MSKYRNRKYHGFDSKKEAERYHELALMQRAGLITGLQRQVKFELLPSQYDGRKCVFRAVNYFADFVYQQDGKLVVEDVKGFRTKDYILKAKMMYFFHHIKIKET